MPSINHLAREIQCQIVYYGPLSAGKTTCIKCFLHVDPSPRGKTRYDPQAELTTRFDFIAPDVPPTKGMSTRLFLSTISGWAFPDADRRRLVKNVDGVVFVADSRRDQHLANLESMQELGENLRAHGVDPARLPMVLLYNKRDLPEIVPVDEMNAALNVDGRPYFEGIAEQGKGVVEALSALTKRILGSAPERDPMKDVSSAISAVGISARRLPSPPSAVQAPEIPRALARPIFGLHGKIRHADGERPDFVMVAVVAKGPSPNLLGTGFVRSDFCLSFTREAFDPAGSGPVQVPDLYVVLSVETAAGDGVVAVHRQDFPSLPFKDVEDLGTIVLPLRKGEAPVAVPGLESAPGCAVPRKRLRLDDELVLGSAVIVALFIEHDTGWTGLLKGVRFEIVDTFVEALRRRVETALGRRIDDREAETLEQMALGFQAYAFWDPSHSVVYLNRTELEQQSFDFFKCVLGHELVHVGQSKNHPELDAQVATELAKIWTARLAGQSPTEESCLAIFGIMANLEGYADYIETVWLKTQFWPCSMQLARSEASASAPTFAEVRRSHTELDLLEDASPARSLAGALATRKIAQYESGRRAYMERGKSTEGKAARFDPSLRPEPILDWQLLHHLEERALAGCSTTQEVLGDFYRTGMVGVTVDRTKALRWYRLAAAAGSAHAQHWLGELDTPADRREKAPTPRGLAKGTRVEVLEGLHEGERGYVIAERGEQILVDLDTQRMGARLVMRTFKSAALRVEPRVAPSVAEMLAETRHACSSTDHDVRKLFWWAARLAEGEGATDEGLLRIGDEFAAFEVEVDAEFEIAFGVVEGKFHEAFDPLDDDGRAERWAREHHQWTEPGNGKAVFDRLSASVGVGPGEDPGFVARRALLARGKHLRNRVGLARRRARGPRERNEALEAAIASSPDDRAGYLVYADWLNDRGDPRGELIALQSARTIVGRVDGFIDAHAAELLGELSLYLRRRLTGAFESSTYAGHVELNWHLGFVREARLIVTRAQAEQGIRGVGLGSRLLALASARFLRSLTLEGDGHDPSEVRALLGNERLPLLRSFGLAKLDLSYDLCAAVVESPLIPQLEVLDLSETALTDNGAMALIVHGKRLKHLRRLDVNASQLSDSVAKRLRVSCPAMSTEKHQEAVEDARRRAAEAKAQPLKTR